MREMETFDWFMFVIWSMGLFYSVNGLLIENNILWRINYLVLFIIVIRGFKFWKNFALDEEGVK